MVIFRKTADLQDFLLKHRATGTRKTGFVPTMGALHQGHISLLNIAKEDNNLAVVSIFVNPTQFNDKSDYNQYPESVDQDILMLEEAGCDVLLLPDVNEIYPGGPGKMQTFGFGYLDTLLEGAHRPGHFKGVGQVVARLLDVVNPDKLYMGQKDYQQCIVISHLLQLLGKDKDIELGNMPHRTRGRRAGHEFAEPAPYRIATRACRFFVSMPGFDTGQATEHTLPYRAERMF